MNECKHKWIYAAGLHLTICELCHAKKKQRDNKYGAKRTTYNGKSYPSQKQAKYAARLDAKVKEGSVLYYLEEVPLRYTGGGYLKIDFIIFNANLTVDYVDTKGFITAVYKAKKRIIEATYPIKIKEV